MSGPHQCKWGRDPREKLPRMAWMLWGLVRELECKLCGKRLHGIARWPERRYMRHLGAHMARDPDLERFP